MQPDESWKRNVSYFTLQALFTSTNRRDDLIAVSIWTIMLLYALISNLLILAGIARSSTMRSATSYWFIISIALCDILMTFISLGHLVPATAFHEQFVSIVYPMEYKHIFSRARSLYLILLGYFLGFIVSLPTLFDCCHTLWDSNYYITVYEKPGTLYKYVDMAVNSISLCMMIISYAVIIYKVRESGRAMAKYQLTIRTRQQNALVNGVSLSCQINDCGRTSSMRPPRSQVSKKEMRLFIQFFVVSLVFLVTWTTWQWLPYMSESKWAYFVMTSLFFINNSVNPTVYLIFNTQLRRELHYLLCRHHAISTAQNKRKHTLFGRGIAASNKLETDFQNNTRDDATKSLVDQAGSLSSQSHATIDEHVRAQLLIKNMDYADKDTKISAV
ncbi:unnamed protein product [Caenorhabditis sp. 36 PRJEB53466]|nr:unnamed protein product [Caenorhabditis sp. 36 PRJEB53466]